ncbi:sialate O-acetylesterase [Flavobacterium agrisoli]|uniref:sialate O-acetylesterase n=1 Tax=Flavobacterium agrisoli TaxID=2793066 RepID=UPI001F33FE9B|nr:sialate O-acetylesterase [Flavobacterium agrisoli]
MKKSNGILLLVFSLLTICLQAQIKLPRLISNGMVLQRETKLKIWGWASANESVEIQFKTKTYKTKADAQGNWMILLPKQKAGGPYEMVFKGRNTITLSDILFGDVWVCSGQSNMELPMERVKEKYGKEIASATNTNIRQFLVLDKYDFKKENTDFDSGNWMACTPKEVLDFTAVGYFFAKAITEKYPIPIGLINTALGGSPVESWMSKKALQPFPEALQEAEKFKNEALIEDITQSEQKKSDAWYAELNQKDAGLQNNKPIWLTNFPTQSEEMNIPGYWAEQTSLGNLNGVIWFQKEIEVPKTMASKPAKLFLGRLVDQDYVYLNENFIGTTGYQYPPRRYEVAPSLLKEGKNTITVRLINSTGKGGFVLDKPYYLAIGNDTINLKGKWNYHVGAKMPSLAGPTFIRWKPEGLYNAMIAPLLSYRIKGVLWYQGESNTGNPSEYQRAFSSLILDWRKNWSLGDFPFLFCN